MAGKTASAPSGASSNTGSVAAKTGNMRTPFRTSWPYVAFAALLFVFFFPVVFCGKVLAPLDILDHLMRPWSDGAGGFGVHNAMVYDAISQYLPYDWAVCQSLKQDGFIGWNPYVYGGYALLENTMLCPGDWHHQLYRFFDFWTAWDLGIVLQFAIAGIGTIVMLRGEKLPPFAALAGAVSFAFYSQHVIWIYHRWVLGASCWFPWIVWAVRRARRSDRIFDVWSIAFVALAFRGGSLQSGLFVALLVACLLVADLFESGNRTGFRLRNVFFFYGSLTLFSTLLFSDVLLDTVPAWFSGCRQMARKSFLDGARSLPHLATSFVPSLFGTPQTLDAGKFFGTEMFDVKFAGAVPAAVACLALADKRAPLAAKAMFAVSAAIPFTPLGTWFYSRSTVVFALGCAWLFAHALSRTRNGAGRVWKRLACCFAVFVFLWCVAGIVETAFHPRFRAALLELVDRSIPTDRLARRDWLLTRADAFLVGISPWNALHPVEIVSVFFGLFSAWRLCGNGGLSRFSRRCWSGCLIGCVFAELSVFAWGWISVADRPDSADNLFPERKWLSEMRAETDRDGLLWFHGTRNDFDYLQFNVLSGAGISSLQGYETIRPRSLEPPPPAAGYDPVLFADLGVSHVLVEPGTPVPPSLGTWPVAIDSENLRLFRNPAFRSRWTACRTDGTPTPLTDLSSSPNRHVFHVPEKTETVLLSEPFNSKWTIAGDLTRQAAPTLSPRADGGMAVSFRHPTPTPSELRLEFRPGYRILSLVQSGALVFLALTAAFRRRSKTDADVDCSEGARIQ